MGLNCGKVGLGWSAVILMCLGLVMWSAGQPSIEL